MATVPMTSDLKHEPVPGATEPASPVSSHDDINLEKQHNVEPEAQDVESNNDNQLQTTKSAAPSEFEYPSMKKAILILMALYLSVFVIAIDRTIIGVAIPKITDEFKSFGDIAWYQSAFMLTTAGFQLFYGKVYTFYSPKWTWVCAIFIFEVGSTICAAAPTSTAFIVGRAVSGLGAAGMFGGSMVILINTMPLHKRPVAMGLIGGIFGIASVAGPLLGGAFTDSSVTWRFCFWINLPIGGISIITGLFFIHLDTPMAAKGKSLSEKFWQLDPVGTLLFLPSIVCLLLALQWGGATYAWSNGRVVALLVLFVVLLIAFILLQVFRNEDRVTVPVRLFKNRNIIGGLLYTVFGGGVLVMVTIYLPIWFEAIKGYSAVGAGIRIIPTLLSMVLFIIVSGILVQKTGYYTPFMIAGATLMPIGAGLLSTLTVDSNHSKWIGYQCVIGFGMGLGLQQPMLAAQTVLSRKDVPIGVSILMLGQSLGGSIFPAVGQNVLDSALIKNLGALHIPNFDSSSVITSGATDIRTQIPAAYLPAFLVAYNKAIIHTFYVMIGCACVTIVGALLLEWKSVKKAKAAAAATPAQVENGTTEQEQVGEQVNEKQTA